ncbi:hypothetical protein LC612_32300 [Nostoc sp. CHAB 5834]|nr:hypothetical protein [Nostoc sp. CHAB 5834]
MNALVLKACEQSAQLRLMLALGVAPKSAMDWGDRSSPYCLLNDSLLETMHSLGKQAQLTGYDIRDSAFWDLLEHKYTYVDAFERGRIVSDPWLTPKALAAYLRKGNTVVFHEWALVVEEACEETGEHGEPIWTTPVSARHIDGRKYQVPTRSDDNCRDLYEVVTGITVLGNVKGASTAWPNSDSWPGQLAA